MEASDVVRIKRERAPLAGGGETERVPSGIVTQPNLVKAFSGFAPDRVFRNSADSADCGKSFPDTGTPIATDETIRACHQTPARHSTGSYPEELPA